MNKEPRSTPVDYFEDIYRSNPDPWSYSWLRSLRTAFSGHFYERRKYWKTMRIIPRQRYQNALEIGCSIGVFTRSLARRCELLLAIDYSPTALALARERCRQQEHVEFREASVPGQFPAGEFDLIVFSEVAYYLAPEDLSRRAGRFSPRYLPEDISFWSTIGIIVICPRGGTSRTTGFLRKRALPWFISGIGGGLRLIVWISFRRPAGW